MFGPAMPALGMEDFATMTFDEMAGHLTARDPPAALTRRRGSASSDRSGSRSRGAELRPPRGLAADRGQRNSLHDHCNHRISSALSTAAARQAPLPPQPRDRAPRAAAPVGVRAMALDFQQDPSPGDGSDYERLLALDETIKRKGVSEREKLRIPVFKAEKRHVSLDCCICMSRFSAASTLCKLKCGHIFHDDCLFKWLQSNRSCPTCRQEV